MKMGQKQAVLSRVKETQLSYTSDHVPPPNTDQVTYWRPPSRSAASDEIVTAGLDVNLIDSKRTVIIDPRKAPEVLDWNSKHKNFPEMTNATEEAEKNQQNPWKPIRESYVKWGVVALGGYLAYLFTKR